LGYLRKKMKRNSLGELERKGNYRVGDPEGKGKKKWATQIRKIFGRGQCRQHEKERGQSNNNKDLVRRLSVKDEKEDSEMRDQKKKVCAAKKRKGHEGQGVS